MIFYAFFVFLLLLEILILINLLFRAIKAFEKEELVGYENDHPDF